jgi:hypothetical protein
MNNAYVYSVEIFANGHWSAVKDSTGIEDEDRAVAMARVYAATNDRVSVAAYLVDSEGSSAVLRTVVQS